MLVLTGLCALSISNDNCYLAYPGSATIGEVQVFDTVNLVGELWLSVLCSAIVILNFLE